MPMVVIVVIVACALVDLDPFRPPLVTIPSVAAASSSTEARAEAPAVVPPPGAPEPTLPATRSNTSLGASAAASVSRLAPPDPVAAPLERPSTERMSISLARASDFVAQYPDGHEELLLSVPKYDFNWQTTYTLKTPLQVPAGTKIVHTTVYDNSVQNPANPDPNRTVPWGEQSFDEMLYGVVQFRELTPVGTAEQVSSNAGK